MNRIIMYGHTGSYNRGYEVIIRSIAKTLSTKLPDTVKLYVEIC